MFRHKPQTTPFQFFPKHHLPPGGQLARARQRKKGSGVPCKGSSLKLSKDERVGEQAKQSLTLKMEQHISIRLQVAFGGGGVFRLLFLMLLLFYFRIAKPFNYWPNPPASVSPDFKEFWKVTNQDNLFLDSFWSCYAPGGRICLLNGS